MVTPCRLGTRSPGHGVLIIDEVGFEPMTRQEASLFFRLVSYRYGRGSILITTNKGVAEWPAVLAGDEVLATAILDRLPTVATSSTSAGGSTGCENSTGPRRQAATRGEDRPASAGLIPTGRKRSRRRSRRLGNGARSARRSGTSATTRRWTSTSSPSFRMGLWGCRVLALRAGERNRAALQPGRVGRAEESAPVRKTLTCRQPGLAGPALRSARCPQGARHDRSTARMHD